MVYAPHMSKAQIAATEAEIDEAFERIKESGFLKPSTTTKPSNVRNVQQERTGRTVVVEKKVVPRFTLEQVRARMAADEAQKREKLMADQVRKRQENEARQTLRNPTLPPKQRIAAAEFLGYSMTFRGLEYQPCKVVLRGGGERVAIMFPKGKNARRRQMTWH